MKAIVFICMLAVACADKSAESSRPAERSERTSSLNPIAPVLKKLLERMDSIAEHSSEIEDTDVREQMHEAVLQAFILRKSGYTLPTSFGMFGADGNLAVRSALLDFLKDAEPAASQAGLSSPQARLDAFQDGEIASAKGTRFDDYFGEGTLP